MKSATLIRLADVLGVSPAIPLLFVSCADKIVASRNHSNWLISRQLLFQFLLIRFNIESRRSAPGIFENVAISIQLSATSLKPPEKSFLEIWRTLAVTVIERRTCVSTEGCGQALDKPWTSCGQTSETSSQGK